MQRVYRHRLPLLIRPYSVTILNIGCGTKTSDDPRVVNIDFSIYLRIKRNPLLRPVRLLLPRSRREKLDSLPDSIKVWDLRKGIPYPENSVDAVYHSHFLEHLDRDVAPVFLREALRALKPGGVHRIVVPDMEFLCRRYLQNLEAGEPGQHDDYIAEIVEQMVRRESAGSRNQRPIVRFLENLILGDARKKGETHQWMYDRVNLPHLLTQVGYVNPVVVRHDTSNIANWNSLGLDLQDGSEYKPGSLYVEAFKSGARAVASVGEGAAVQSA